jgi:hypothetical protein
VSELSQDKFEADKRQAVAPAGRTAYPLPRFVSAEANFLRLPLFALATKGLRTLDGIQCSGSVNRNGIIHRYTLRCTRNTDTYYPGPLARAAHVALLSLVTEAGLPFQNPLTWTWRDLCRRIGIRSSGRTQEHLQAAITSTAGLMLKSEQALYSKAQGKPVHKDVGILHLYENIVFVGGELPDGGRADTNRVWFADWYLANLNALYTAPLNYELWRALNAKSTIASRLYEFLLLNFYSGTPMLRINYPNLAKFLPVKVEKYASKAREQLGPPLELLKEGGVLSRYGWLPKPSAVAQLHLHRGKLLTAPGDRQQGMLPFMEEEFSGEIEVKELRDIKPAEWGLVADFYQRWSGERFPRPTAKEIEQAKGLLGQYGEKKAKALIPLVVERMKKKWPDAKSFGAIVKYLPEVARVYERNQRQADKKEGDRADRIEQERKFHEDCAQDKKLTAEWRALPEEERAEIIAAVRAKHPNLNESGSVFESGCIGELRRRQRSAGPRV